MSHINKVHKEKPFTPCYNSAVSFRVVEKMEDCGIYLSDRKSENDCITYAQVIDFLINEGIHINIRRTCFEGAMILNPDVWMYDISYTDEQIYSQKLFPSFREAADDAIMKAMEYYDI